MHDYASRNVSRKGAIEVSSEIIMRYLSKGNEVQKLRLQIALQCAPVMKGIKASNIIAVSKEVNKKIQLVLYGTGVTYVTLFENDKKVILFLYREKQLLQYLNKREIQEFLNYYGYEMNQQIEKNACDISNMLKRLAKRLECYYGKKEEFPHELGVFLEYPLEDVRSFILYKGKYSLLSGYWKVYSNLEYAEKVFLAYDLAKEEVVKAVIQGKAFYEVTSK